MFRSVNIKTTTFTLNSWASILSSKTINSNNLGFKIEHEYFELKKECLWKGVLINQNLKFYLNLCMIIGQKNLTVDEFNA